jgi:hypothetical protein
VPPPFLRGPQLPPSGLLRPLPVAAPPALPHRQAPARVAWPQAGALLGGTAPPTRGTPTFRTSRPASAARAALFVVLALLGAETADPTTGSESALVRLLAFVAFVWFGVLGIRWFVRAVRPQSSAEVGPDGLLLRLGRAQWQLPWSAVARVRVVDGGRRPTLVVWPAAGGGVPAAFGAASRRYYGGVRVLPVARGHLPKRRMREVLELRAALAWYGRQVYDSSP